MSWTVEHRRAVGQLIDNELGRRGWKKEEAALKLGVTTKTLQRARAGTADVSVPMLIGLADRLEIPDELVIPPRPEAEQVQLDRIEAMLVELLARTTPADEDRAADEMVEVLEEVEQQPDPQQAPSAATAPRSRRSRR